MLVHGLFVLGLDSNLFEFKWNGLNGLSVERKKEKKKDRQKSPAAQLSTSGLSFLSFSRMGHGGPAPPFPPRASLFFSLPTWATPAQPAPFLSQSRVPVLPSLFSLWQLGPACQRFLLPLLVPSRCATPSPITPASCSVPGPHDETSGRALSSDPDPSCGLFPVLAAPPKP
jgi:hypothetical protein